MQFQDETVVAHILNMCAKARSAKLLLLRYISEFGITNYERNDLMRLRKIYAKIDITLIDGDKGQSYVNDK